MLERLCIAATLAVLAAGSAAAQQNPSFYLINRSQAAIREVYASAAGNASWGTDRLGNNSIPSGQSYPIRLPADGNCVYDVKVVYANGQTDERRNLNTCNVDNVSFPTGRGGSGNPAQQTTNDPSFRLVNRGGSEVNEVYASLSGNESWGRDRLGDDTVPAGSSTIIRLPSGQCLYDVRVVFANGEATERRRVNLCTITDLRVP